VKKEKGGKGGKGRKGKEGWGASRESQVLYYQRAEGFSSERDALKEDIARMLLRQRELGN
jgi:hypothetical protein